VARTALRWLLALGLLGGLNCAYAASPVWAIRGPHSTLYLAGSIHLLPANDAALPEGFTRAYADSAKLVMEMDLGKVDPVVIAQWIAANGALPPGTHLREVLGEQRYARVSAAATELGVSAQLLDTQAPWVVGLELADLTYVHEGFDPQQGVEEQLLRRAQADGKATAGLETLSEELGGLQALSAKDQLELIDQTLDELKDPDPEMQAILGAWRAGDAKKLGALLADEFRTFPALYRPLVTTRNEHWLPQIEQLLRGNENCLVVVGSLHLVGPGGLLEMLRKDGFRETQLN
jgi:uncharacterized protein